MIFSTTWFMPTSRISSGVTISNPRLDAFNNSSCSAALVPIRTLIFKVDIIRGIGYNRTIIVPS